MKIPQLTKLAVNALEDLKAHDIKVLDVRQLTTITDTMIICTGTSTRHVKSLAQNVMDESRNRGVRPMGCEGLDEGEWALVDLGGVVVHVMQGQTRLFYQLEKLWDIAEQAPKFAEAKVKKEKKAAKKTVAKAGKSAKKSAAKKAPAKKAAPRRKKADD